MQDKVDALVVLKDRKGELENEAKKIKDKIDTLTAELIGYLDQNTHVDKLKATDGRGLTRSARRSPDIVDWPSLHKWAFTEGDELVSEWWDGWLAEYKPKDLEQGIFRELPNKKLLGVIIKHFADVAKAEGKDLYDLLPPGLGQKATEFFRVVKAKPTKKHKDDSILAMAKKGALVNG